MASPRLDLTAAYEVRTASIRARLDQVIRRAWRLLPDVSDRSLALWLEVVTPVVAGSQEQIATLTAAYVGASTGSPLSPARADLGAVRGGVPLASVYERPIIEVRSLLGAGQVGSVAFAAGERRALGLARTDLQLARTHQAKTSMEADDRVTGYRRVLTGAESCGLCSHAATRRYNKSDLLPIHPGCDCGIAPIVGTNDPGEVWNQDKLDDLKAQGVKPVLTEVYDHGEYGPTLGVEGQHHLTGSDPSDRPDAEPPDEAP